MSEPISVSLGLGSGGARGYAHIGVLRWIEERGLRVRAIAGSSMGALVGGIYAAGRLDDFEQWARTIRKSDILGLLDVVFGKTGLVEGGKLMQALEGFVGDLRIEDLELPFTAVASDVAREKEVWLASGPLFDAIRASISIPLFFVPHELDGRELLDGGILEPVPVAPTLDHRSDLTVAVNLTGPVVEDWSAGVDLPERPADDRGRVRRAVDGMLDALHERALNGDGPSMLDLAADVIDTMQGAIARMKLAAHPPDVEIAIPRNVARVLEFDRAAELIEVGRRAAEEQLGPVLERRGAGPS
ncbi:MAG: patatin-like phospholipase family protein [Planctomycetota bacterium]